MHLTYASSKLIVEQKSSEVIVTGTRRQKSPKGGVEKVVKLKKNQQCHAKSKRKVKSTLTEVLEKTESRESSNDSHQLYGFAEPPDCA